MRTIYCISGLGADERAFSKLTIEGYRLHCIQWLKPFPNGALGEYARRMKESITESNPILLGLSFGGIMCVEIAKQISVEKIIIVSSIRSSKELPHWIRIVAKLSLHKIVPLRPTKLSVPFQDHFLGVITADDKRIVEYYRRHADISYVKWAVDKVINWKSDTLHSHTFHIHGDRDKIFPINKTVADHIVQGGGHFMIMNKAEEVSRYINSILQNKM